MTSFSLSELSKQVPFSRSIGEASFSRLSTDTRSLVAGDLFVALVGPNFDGHEFIAQAQSQGACAALVSTEIDTNLPLLVVPDTRIALGQLAQIKRQTLDGQFVAVTGSSGKTTVKEMLQKVLFEAGQAEVTQGNFNNDIGVPLTLWGMHNDIDYKVLELGANHIGEIAYTSRMVMADVAILNNAQEAHLSGFGGLSGVAKAKGEIITGLSSQGQVVLNLDDPHFNQWKVLAEDRRIWSFSLNNSSASVYARDIQNTPQGSRFTLHIGEQQRQVSLALLGIHNVANALATTAAALALGLSLDQVVAGLAQARPYQGRLVSHQLSNDRCIIDDTYNANPGSVKAAIDVLEQCQGVRCFMLGDLGELGSQEVALHQRIGAQVAAAGIEQFYGFGPLAAAAIQSYQQCGGGYGKVCADKKNLYSCFEQLPKADFSCLVKGSRSSQMEHVVELLINNGN
ncbi:MAG: UDP-N-acetylmuramoyl-tripeptide--D-alanyl-D-alanine ligase [Gammaproteobacteria bacterium]|nr:UDP-N-acetylmuramoyl-tripeptide--D-alanyl-D-alanine ligase [Gammaproteobacteria bacterium]